MAGTDPVDVFVSYTGVDSRWATWIAWQLEQAGYSVFVQAWDIRPGHDFVQRMHSALEKAKRTVVLLSPTYLKSSAFGEAEWRSAFAADPSGEDRRLVPVRVKECRPEGLLRTRVYIDLVRLNEQQACAALLGGLADEVPREQPPFPSASSGSVTSPGFPGALPPVFSLPGGRSSLFVGRQQDLASLADRFGRKRLAGEPPMTIVLTGLGGVGKTQLAVEYAYAHTGRYDVVWWLRAQEPTTAIADLAGLAETPGLPDPPAVLKDDVKQAAAAARDWLERHEQWLLVVDNVNVDDAEVVQQLLPRGGGGHVLITARPEVGWAGLAEVMPVEVLDEDSAARFVLERTGDEDEQAARALAQTLGGLALALQQAAGYIAEGGGITVADYLQLYNTRSRELLARGRPSDRNDTVATTWSLSLDRLATSDPAAVALLALTAFMAPEDFPTTLLQTRPELLDDLLAAVADPIGLADALTALRHYGLVTVEADMLSVHQVLQTVIRDALPPGERQRVAGLAVEVLAASFPGEGVQDPDSWPAARQLLPHVLAATAESETFKVMAQASSWLLDRAGTYLHATGQYGDALPVLERALASGEAALGANHPTVATCRNNLGRVLHDVGQLEAAREQFERALGISEAALGPDHPTVATCRNNLGGVLRQLDAGDGVGIESLTQPDP
jgi:tetratricopeptide (TPR) repeat protein